MRSQINTIIIDDEEVARDALKRMFEKFIPEIEIVGEASSIREGTSLLQNYKDDVDLVFLDIKMQYGTGFDILENLDQINFGIIFVTAYDQYAINAFKFSAIDYLLKPIKISALKEAIQKYKTHYDHKNTINHIHVLRDNLENPQKEILKIVLPTIDGFHIINIKDIIRLEGMRNYTKVYLTGDKNMVVSRTMKEYEPLLTAYGFLRIHLSHLISLHHVKRYIKGQGGEVEMSDGSIITMSRNKKKIFLDMFS